MPRRRRTGRPRRCATPWRRWIGPMTPRSTARPISNWPMTASPPCWSDSPTWKPTQGKRLRHGLRRDAPRTTQWLACRKMRPGPRPTMRFLTPAMALQAAAVPRPCTSPTTTGCCTGRGRSIHGRGGIRSQRDRACMRSWPKPWAQTTGRSCSPQLQERLSISGSEFMSMDSSCSA